MRNSSNYRYNNNKYTPTGFARITFAVRASSFDRVIHYSILPIETIKTLFNTYNTLHVNCLRNNNMTAYSARGVLYITLYDTISVSGDESHSLNVIRYELIQYNNTSLFKKILYNIRQFITSTLLKICI
uniref:Uncharacterized protein n=1 Tax=Schizaphis graminum TaxID=13262 RepID=A0A2S2P059_SCHGA